MSLIRKVQTWFSKNTNAEKLRLLRQQRLILSQGLATTAEVMEARLCGDRIGKFQPVQLRLKILKHDGEFFYISTSSIISTVQFPLKGELLQIRYIPQDLRSIVIL